LLALSFAIGGLVPAATFASVPLVAANPRAIGPINGLVAQAGSLGSLVGPPLLAGWVDWTGWSWRNVGRKQLLDSSIFDHAVEPGKLIVELVPLLHQQAFEDHQLPLDGRKTGRVDWQIDLRPIWIAGNKRSQ